MQLRTPLLPILWEVAGRQAVEALLLPLLRTVSMMDRREGFLETNHQRLCLRRPKSLRRRPVCLKWVCLLHRSRTLTLLRHDCGVKLLAGNT